MGKVIHLEKIKEFAKKTPVFRSKDVEIMTKDRDYAYLALHNLMKKGVIKRVTRGCYTSHDDPALSVFCFKPAYIGLQDALSLHGLWEQETNVVIVTSLKIRPGLRDILGNNVILHRTMPRYVFGFEYLRYGDFFIPVSDIEKTLIDLIYFNETPSRDVIKKIVKRIDTKKTENYLKKYSKRFREKAKRLIEQ